ncbi:hypothetical protein NC653_007134 [Populus alba x Populus x berolinensis]|uniref:Uncharacterized protein n=1 Tax=Populus alba x Populus x berolinensis TaxID=444605 RepID=A0AAD6RGL3_9ROSI|nr:hypothetical protein NC653_007134 [Populus alba x Populus x berolinensis]
MSTYHSGRGQQKEAISSYNLYDDCQSKHSNKECWIVTPKQRPNKGRMKQQPANL